MAAKSAIKTRITYQPVEDLIVIEFFDEVFTRLSFRAVEEQQWGMFTHGVCCPCYGKRLHSMHKIALTGWHLLRTEAGINDALDRAMSKLNYMAHESVKRRSGDESVKPFAEQCRVGARLLTDERELLVKELLASWRHWPEMESENLESQDTN